MDEKIKEQSERGESLQRIREMFAGDVYATQITGVTVEDAASGYAKCSLKIEDYHKNAMGRVMGGVLFTMADYAFAIAANLEHRPTVTQSAQITYLHAVRGNILYAETQQIKTGGTTCFYKVEIRDELDTEIAYITMTGFTLK